MSIHQVKVGKDTYNIAECPAEKQLELFEMFSARILANAVSSGREEIDSNVVFGVLMSSPKGTISDTADIVLWNTVKHGTTEKVMLSQFGNRIDEYVSLVSEGVCANLAGFFDYIGRQVKTAKEEIQAAKDKENARL